MASQVIPNGIYGIMGPGGQLSMGPGMVALMEPGMGPAQQWNVTFSNGSYTLRNVQTGQYLGSDRQPGEIDWMLQGCDAPFTWTLTQGPDDDDNTFFVNSAAAPDRLRLTPSIIRVWPPRVALGPQDPAFDFEWAFEPAS